MKKLFLQLCLLVSAVIFTNTANALTDSYFASGEDIDFLEEVDSTFALREIEYKLRRFTLFRKLEEFVQSIHDDYIEDGK